MLSGLSLDIALWVVIKAIAIFHPQPQKSVDA